MKKSITALRLTPLALCLILALSAQAQIPQQSQQMLQQLMNNPAIKNNPQMQQQLKQAQAQLNQKIKDKQQQDKQEQQDIKDGKLPAKYDNSWHINATITKTYTTKEQRSGKDCSYSESETITIRENFSSDKMISYGSSDFTIEYPFDKYKQFYTPLSGNITVQDNYENSEGATKNINVSVKPANMGLSFEYDKDDTTGKFNVIPGGGSVDNAGVTTVGSMIEIGYDANGHKVKIPEPDAAVQNQGNALALMTETSCQDVSHNPYVTYTTGATTIENIAGLISVIGNAHISAIKGGYEVTGNTNESAHDSQGGECTTTRDASVSVTVHVTITGKPVQYDAILEVIGGASPYNKWIPKGSPAGSPGVQGNHIAFDVYLVNKDTKEVDAIGEKFDVDYKLTDVSKEPGYCNNYPLEEGTKKPDLIFDSSLMLNSSFTYQPDRVYTKNNDGKNKLVTLTSYDYGSFAKMQVNVTTEDGIQLQAHFKDSTKTIITLPMDNNNNQIADKWENDNAILADNYPKDWDNEDQPGNDHNGDGLTLYEEYRGIIAKGKYTRLDPNYKELFVLNKIGAKAKAGMDLFQSASRIKVVELADGDIDENDLVVNINSDYARMGKQHALLLKPYNAPDDSTLLGYTPPKTGRGNPTSPGNCDYVGIAVSNPQLSGNPEELNITIAHEMAHGCGVLHHGDADPLPPPDKDNLTDPSYLIYAEDMTLLDAAAVQQKVLPKGIQGGIAGPGSSSSGDLHCIMAYNHTFSWAAPKGTEGKIYINSGNVDKFPQTIFCTSPKGTEINAPNHKMNDKMHTVLPVYGDAAPDRGDCMNQFKIKDW